MPLFPLISLGLEYFDYILFPLMSTILIKAFFYDFAYPNILSFLFFTITPFVKIFSVLIFSALENKYSIKKIINISTFTMTVATGIIGLMPYGFTPWFYFIIFTILRLLQTFSVGIDVPATVNLAYKVNHDNASEIGKTILSASIGYIIVLSAVNVLYKTLSYENVVSFGWRIPFLMASFTGILSFRYRLQSKTSFLKTREKQNNQNFKNIIQGISIMLFPATLNTINLFFPKFFNQYYNINLLDITYYQLLSLLFSIFVNIAIIKLNIKNLKKIYLTVLISFMFSVFCFEKIYQMSLLLFMCIWQFYITSAIIISLFLNLKSMNANQTILSTGLTYNCAFLISSVFEMLFYKFYFLSGPTTLFYIILIPASITLITLIINFKKSF